jgi:carbamoyl-phosphate synthase large subunit
MPALEPLFPDFLAEVISTYDIDLVFFGIEPEIDRIVSGKNLFKGDFSRLVLNKPELIAFARDKWFLHEMLCSHNFQAIPTLIDGEYADVIRELGSPCLLKPRRSSASKGICEIHTSKDYYYWKDKLGSNFMVQQIIGDNDHEYTVGVFGLGDGSFSQSISFVRKLSRDGSTVKAKTVIIPALDHEVASLCRLFKPVGPTNFQFRLHDGVFFLLEINPRISSSSSLRTAFGFNEAEMCISFFCENKTPKVSILSQGEATRYIEDIVRYL